MCWSNHEFRGSWQRQVRRRDPMTRADVRVSDAERHEVIEQLSRHTGEGRLTLDEFEERVELALEARTRGELDTTLRGLPSSSGRRTTRFDIGDAFRPIAAIALIALAIVAMGAWVLWIVVPLVLCRRTGRHRHWTGGERPHEESDREPLTLV